MIVAEGGKLNSLKQIQQMYTNGHATKGDYAKALRAHRAFLAEIKVLKGMQLLQLMQIATISLGNSGGKIPLLHNDGNSGEI